MNTSRLIGGVRCVGCLRRFAVAAAERLHQGDVEGEAARLQVGQTTQAAEQDVFGGKHFDIRRKSALVTIV